MLGRYIWCAILVCVPLLAQEKPTVCLNMIVKNEAHVIERCLESVRPLITSWVIVDTGSTDGTQDIIRTYLSDIPGTLYERPWKNFEHNRNEALALAKERADYLLIVDADDIIEHDAHWDRSTLTKDGYLMTVTHGGLSYPRIQIIKTALPWRWEGVLHEVLTCDAPCAISQITSTKYQMLGGGARSLDPKKYENDAHVLMEAVKLDPENTRYTFYLAQSLRDAEKPEEAILWYQKRASMGGWKEEIFWSLLQIARLSEQVGKEKELVLDSYQHAYRVLPYRAEPVYYSARLLNQLHRYDLAYAALKARRYIADVPLDESLFVEKWIYDYGLLFELSLCSYYVGQYQESLELCDQLLQKHLPEHIRALVIENRAFAFEKVFSLANEEESLVAR